MANNREENHPPEDRLEAQLAALPAPPLAPDLGLRICQALHRRRRRSMRVRFALSACLELAGAWLAIPLLRSAAQRLELPASGVPVVLDSYAVARSDLGVWLEVALRGLLTLQENVSNGLETAAWVGLLILALGAVLALEQFLPRGGTG